MAFDLGAVTFKVKADTESFNTRLKEASNTIEAMDKKVQKAKESIQAINTHFDKYNDKLWEIQSRQKIVNQRMEELAGVGKAGTTTYKNLEIQSGKLDLALINTNTQIKNATQKMAEYDKKIQDATEAKKKFAVGGTIIGGSIGEVLTKVDNATKSFSFFNGNLEMSRGSLLGLAGGFAGATGAVAGATGAVAGFALEIGGKVVGFVQDLIGKLTILSGVVGTAFAGLATYGLNLASKLQDSRISLETILGSPEKARSLLKDITAFAKRTPFNRLELVDYAKQLSGAGIAQEEMIDTLERLGNLSSAYGADLGMMIYNYGQIRANQRAYTIDLKEFSRYGIPIFDVLAKKMGITVEKLRGGIDSKKIKVSYQQVQDAIVQLTSVGGPAFDIMGKKSKTFNGALSNVQDTLEGVILKFMGVSDTGDITQGSFFDMAQNKALELQAWLNANEEQIGGWGSRVFTKIGQGMQMAWDYIISPALVDFQDWFNNGGKEAIKGFLRDSWDKFKNSLIYFKDEIWPTLKQGIKDFSDYLASEQFKKNLQDFKDILNGINQVFGWIRDTLNNVKWLLDKIDWGKVNDVLKIASPTYSNTSRVLDLLGAIGRRASGGPVQAGKLYEVGENNKAEMLVMNGRQYMIPGNNGQVLNQNQINQSRNYTQNIYQTNTNSVTPVWALNF